MTHIPLKRNAKGLRFGFVYLHRNWGLASAISTINNISCGSNRFLKAFESRFPKHFTHSSAPKAPPSPPSSYRPKLFKSRDGRSYLQVVSQAPLKDISIPVESEWLDKSAVVTCKNISAALIIKSLLKDLNIPYQGASLLGDNRVIISFASHHDLTPSCTVKKAFRITSLRSIHGGDKIQASKRFTWMNVYGVPVQFWNIEFFKKIGAACGDFISVAEATALRRRVDVATLLISTSLPHLPAVLPFQINGVRINLRVVENFTEVEMADELDDDRSESSVESAEGRLPSSTQQHPDTPKSKYVRLTEHDDPSGFSDSKSLESLGKCNFVSAQRPSKSDSIVPLAIEEGPTFGLRSKGPDLIVERTSLGLSKTKRIKPSGSITSDYSSLSDADFQNRNKLILHSLATSAPTVEATKSWEVGVLLSLFDVASKAKAEALILQNISRNAAQTEG